VPDEHALSDGDVVEITLDRVGTLRNPVRQLKMGGLERASQVPHTFGASRRSRDAPR